MPGIAKLVRTRIAGTWAKAKRTADRPDRQAALRSSTAWARVLPDYLLIGAQKSGTTSLSACLQSHPNVLPAATKEVHFFDVAHERGLLWYRSHFPTSFTKLALALRLRSRVITGDASPYYICCPHVPERVRRELPGARLLVILRNPVDRAYSNYRHEVQRGRETLSFEAALRAEPERLAGEWERMVREPSYASYNHRHFSYRTRGHYAEQLEHWLANFAKDQFLVLGMEEFLANTRAEYQTVQQFLGIPEKPLARLPKKNVGKRRDPMPQAIREELVRYFEPHNERLYDLLGRRFDWDR